MGLSLLSYEGLSYRIRSKNGESRLLVDDVSVTVRAGELLAIMGPSGAGKSTLLDLMTFRKPATLENAVRLNGVKLTASDMHDISAFVEQEDSLLGTLTPRESVSYSLRLHSPGISSKEVNERVDTVISALGLQSCADQRIRTVFGRGISDGQKRRVSAACAMVTYPRILFLDEVTSGLDSTAAREVIGAIRKLALAEGMIVVATIHQPSMELMSHFDNLLMLAKGKTCYLGSTNGLEAFLEKWGRPTPRFTTPFEHAMNFLNDDFASGTEHATEYGRPDDMHDYFIAGRPKEESSFDYSKAGEVSHRRKLDDIALEWLRLFLRRVWILSQRNALNYSRSLHAYGVRGAMYILVGVFMATIWTRLGLEDSKINDRLAVHFFIPSFLGVISIACVPGFLEERAVYLRESKNGLYTTLPFLTAFTLVNLPFLFALATLFVSIVYWSIGLHSGAPPFFRYLLATFLAILAGESQIVLIASLVPRFVETLTITSAVTACWVCLSGFLIRSRSMPRFWYYTFHQLGYTRYGFESLVTSDLKGLTFRCGRRSDGTCACAYPTPTNDACVVTGEDVLDYLGYSDVSYTKWIGILIGILFGYQLLGYLALRFRTK